MDYNSCPPLYNAYKAKTLCSKFCKNKLNWTFKTDFLKAWLIWSSIFAANLFNQELTIKTVYNLVILRSRSGDPLNSIFGWVNLKSHLTILFNQNLKKMFFLMARFELSLLSLFFFLRIF